jgi:hypothetical protein
MTAGQRHQLALTLEDEGAQNSKSTKALGHREKRTARFAGIQCPDSRH